MWLLEAGVLRLMTDARRNGFVPNAEQQAEFLAACPSAQIAGDTPRLLTVAGDKAEIRIFGAITNRPSFMSFFFTGGITTYAEIISALVAADADDSIASVDLFIESPGGNFAGLFDAVAAIEAFSKPLRAVISNTGASAAFALAVMADEVVATNIAARIGSVGVVVDTMVFDEDISISSTEAPKKRPDLKTEDGKAIIREELDALHQIFVEAIARGRSAATGKTVTVDDVNANFGQGATVLTNEAIKRNMIDGILNTPASTGGADTTTETRMNLEELKAQHPAVYQAAVAEGVTAGIDQERDRVGAHLIKGEASGALEVAIKAVKDGSAMTAVLDAEYFAAGLKRSEQVDTQADSDDADGGDGADGGAAAGGDDGDVADKVATEVEALMGVTGDA